MNNLKKVLADLSKYEAYIKSSVFLELSENRQIVVASRAVRAYEKANGTSGNRLV